MSYISDVIDDYALCDTCQEKTLEWHVCEHGWVRCEPCGLCKDCSVEARRPW